MKILDSLFLPAISCRTGTAIYGNRAWVWLHVVSDALIALAYFSIPITLIYFIRKRRDLPFIGCSCALERSSWPVGTTHAMEVVDTLAWYVLALWCDQSCHCYGFGPHSYIARPF